ncbi:MAG: alcohol dehydrogenase catalytic domain-containing protein [Hyphomicrobiales bacterium]
MRAAVFHDVGQPLHIESVPDPVPGPGEVVVKVGRCGICASDLHMSRDPAYVRAGGVVMGHEFAGEVVARHPDVAELMLGDRIALMPITGCGRCAGCLAGEPAYCRARVLEAGGYAQYALARAREAKRLPANLTMQDGALAEPLAVARHGLRLSRMNAGMRILVMGAGPIGLSTAFWARLEAAGPIAVLARSARHGSLASLMGATAFVEAARLETLEDKLGGPPEIIFECTGQPGMIDEAMSRIARGGTIVVLGICWEPDRIHPLQGIRQECRLQFSAYFTLADFEAAVAVLASGQLAPRAMVTRTISLEELPGMFEELRGPTPHCKVMVDPWSGL